MEAQTRSSGIDLIGNIAWGTHFCQFYKTKDDLLDLLVPYFKAGLENNEFCVWITSEPLEKEEAIAGMQAVLPNFEEYLEQGQIEVIPYSEWYLIDGNFDSQRVLQGWIDKLAKALELGYDGMRVTNNTSWLETPDWKAFTEYGNEIESIIHEYKMIAICSFSLVKCNVNEILDVMSVHQFALIMKDGQWKIVESFDFKRARYSLNETISTLQDLNSRFQGLFNNAIEGISRTTLDGKFLSVNPAFAKIFGHDSPDEILNFVSNIRDLYVDPDRGKEFAKIMQSEGLVKGVEIHIRRKDGSTAWVLVNSRPLVNADGDMIGYESFYNDITELKETEEALQNSEERLQLAQTNASIGVWDWNTRTNKLNFSPELERLYGLEPGSIKTYEDWRSRVLSDDISDVETKRDESVAKHTQFDLEFRIRHSSNQVRWINAKGGASYDYDGEVNRITGINIDITERKHLQEELLIARDKLEARVKARTIDLEIANRMLQDEIRQRERIEKELRESFNKIREQANLLEMAHDAIVVRDTNQFITSWNNGAVQLYGWTPEEAIGKPARSLWYKTIPSACYEAEETIALKGEWSGELPQITKNGKEIIVESRWTLISDNEGNPASILTINTDITEKRELEKQLLRAQRLESVNTLAGGIAHDLNNLLTPVLLSAQLLKDEFSSEQGMELVSILENNAQRSADLIKRIMSFERGTEGERKPLKITDIIKDMETIINETFSRSIETHVDLPRDSAVIMGNPNQLHQLLMNLCTNARDAMPDGGLLTISVESMILDKKDLKNNEQSKPGQYARISVTDTGTGISPEIQEHLFEPFFTTKETGKGSGLGLPIVLSIVKGHGGFIDFSTDEGRGTTFNVFLPMINVAASRTEKHAKELHFGNGESILIVDDEESILMIARTILESHGYKVLEARNGADAIELYRTHRDSIDVCLVDIMMPVMNGIEVIKLIRKMKPHAKFIAMSGMIEKEMEGEIKIANVQGLLQKPYSAEKLLNTLHQFFHGQENE
ncbi:MAG TPA: PAS domain S-box protein [Candidatus Lokiarchaeia archaeon]|nr:PAS domain S-box protein [Candidatus Lokiarchaeia archaeon]